MLFKVHDLVTWIVGADGNLPEYASKCGEGPFKVLAIKLSGDYH